MKAHLLTLSLCLAATIPSNAAPDPAGKMEFAPAFTHTVYFWFKNPDSAEDKKTFETSVKKFMENSEFAKTRFVGIAPKAERDVVDDSFTYSLILSFESAEAQAAYQAEPAHIVFLSECKDLWEKVIVYNSLPLK